MRAHFLGELYLLGALLLYRAAKIELELRIVPAIVPTVTVVTAIVVGRKSLYFKRRHCIDDDVGVLAPALADGDQIGSREASGFARLGLRDELVDDARLGEVSAICGRLSGIVVLARGFEEEGEVRVCELLECREHALCGGAHFCGERAAVDVGEECRRVGCERGRVGYEVFQGDDGSRVGGVGGIEGDGEFCGV